MKNNEKQHGKQIQHVPVVLKQASHYTSPVFKTYGQFTVVSTLHTEVSKRQTEEKHSEEKYQTIIEQATDAILICSFDGTIHEFNKSCYTLLGYSKEEYSKLKLNDILAGSIIENMDNYTAILAGESKTVYRNLICKNGNLIEAEVTIKLLADGKAIAFARDITERKKSELALKESQVKMQQALERYDLLAQATSDTIWDWDIVNNKITYTDIFNTLFGVKSKDISCITDWWKTNIHPEDLERISASLSNIFKNKLPYFKFEYRFRCEDGTYKYIFDRASVLFDEAGKPYRMIGAMQDITERKFAEEKFAAMEKQLMDGKIEEQKKITRAVINAQEKERKHIGEELHDNINQLLASTKLYLSLAGKNDEQLRRILDFPMELIDNTIHEIRMLTRKIVTPIQNVNLKELVCALLACMYKNTLIKTHFDYVGLDDLHDDDLKLNIYRILQEQTNNITKHAGAANVNISIQVVEKYITVVIKDDGAGFNVNTKKEGIGITNITNRVQSFNGEIDIMSDPGQGCTLKIKIPC